MLDGLERRFGDVVALDGLSLRVEPGELHGFVGANGAGKTTAMRIVMGVDDPDGGEVRVDGHRPTRSQRRSFGYMPEERGLYPDMRVHDHLVHLARLHGTDAATARTGATEWLERLGLGERTQSKVEELSLGNQQRVQLAAALVHGPTLLVLDEPFSGLDPVASDLMAEVLAEQAAAGVPVLFSSHQLETVERLCRSVTIIADGRLVATGRVDELRSRRAPRRLRVTVAGDRDGAWVGTVPGVTLVEHRDGDSYVDLGDVDDQRLLDAARAAGSVHRFEPVVPTLAALYREVTR